MSINKQNIKTLLDKRNIKKVLYVDDDFYTDLYQSKFRNYVRDHVNEKIEFPFRIETDDIDITLREFDTWWNNTEDSIKRKSINDLKIDRDKSEIEQKLEQVFGDGILECISHIEFEEKFKDGSNLDFSNENQLLVLMDRDLKEEDGFKLLSPLDGNPYISCGLFSGTFNLEKEIEIWEEYKYSSNVYPLSKHRLNMKEDEFEPGLRNVLWLRQISDSKEKINTIYQEALKSATQSLCHLDPASFDNAVIQNSKEEGCWEFEILQRILNIYFHKAIEEKIINNDVFAEIQKNTGILKEISSLPKPVMPPSQKLTQLRHDEIYLNAEYINKTFSQISLGDIFEIKNDKEEIKGQYMLVCQPCNLELRGSGNRKSKEFVYLLPIEDVFKITDLNDNEQQNKQRTQSYISILEQSYGEKEKCVNLARSVRVCPRVLDLVSFNTNGEGKINLDIQIENLENAILFQENMKKQYSKIKTEIEKYKSIYDEIEKLDFKNKNLKPQLQKLIRKPFEAGTEKVLTIECVKGSNIVDFHFKRVNRYKDTYAQIVLQDFMAYQSRQAFPNDFSQINEEYYGVEGKEVPD